MTVSPSSTTKSQRIDFPGQAGMLAARLDRPAGPAKATILFAHCFTCTKDILAASRMAKQLARHGFAVLRFDFSGLGNSDGDFANTNFSSNLDDLKAAAAHLKSLGTPVDFLVGHSLGGAAVATLGADLPEVRGVAVIGAPADVTHVAKAFELQHDDIREHGEATVSLAGRPFKIRKQFLDDLEQHSVTERVSKLHKPFLVLHAPRDAQVGIENATELFVAAKHPKSFVSLDDADHLLTKERDALYAADVIDAWASRFVELPEPAPVEAQAKPSGNQVTVSETGNGKFQQHVTTADHTLLADEPVSFGGTNTGPTPYDFVAIALGACTSMTLRMYADRKKIPLTRVSVGVDHSKIHADDCEHCDESHTGRIDQFTRHITVEGELDDATRQRLMEIADKCPVHKTLEQSSHIETRLK